MDLGMRNTMAHWCVRYTDHRKGEDKYMPSECHFLAESFDEAVTVVNREFPALWPANDGETFVTALFQVDIIAEGIGNREIVLIDPVEQQRRKPTTMANQEAQDD